jgi:hypothetical protein
MKAAKGRGDLMKKAGIIILGAFLAAVPVFSAEIESPIHLARRFSLNTDTTLVDGSARKLTIPAETEFRVRLLSGVQTQINHLDDRVLAQLTSPVYIDGQMALPEGTYIGGRITAIRTARHFHRAGELAFRFDQIMLPDGEQGPILAVLSRLENPKKLRVRLDSEGHLEGQRHLSWRDFLVGAVSAGGLATAKVLGLSTTGLAVLAPATGAAVLSYELLWGRGSEVNLPPQTPCRLRLQTSIVIRTTT